LAGTGGTGDAITGVHVASGAIAGAVWAIGGSTGNVLVGCTVGAALGSIPQADVESARKKNKIAAFFIPSLNIVSYPGQPASPSH